MSQRLSISITFQALAGRVSALEGKMVAGFTVGGPITVGDGNFGMVFGGSPRLTFDLGDHLGYNRGADLYQFVIGNVSQLDVGTSGISANQFTAPVFVAPGYLGTTGSIQLKRSAAAGFTGILEFIKSDGSRNGYVGFNADAGAIQYGSDTGAGHNFTGGPIGLDANFLIGLSGGNPSITFDSGDMLVFDRTANKFNFFVGGTKIASIDASGNMRLAGTLTQSTTP